MWKRKKTNIVFGIDNANTRVFKETFEKAMKARRQKGPGGKFLLGELSYASSINGITNKLQRHPYEAMFCTETLQREPVNHFNIAAWKELNPDMRIILIFPDEYREEAEAGHKKIQKHFNKGYYDGLFKKDIRSANQANIISLIQQGRSRTEAESYYGLGKEPPQTQAGEARKEERSKETDFIMPEQEEEAIRESVTNGYLERTLEHFTVQSPISLKAMELGQATKEEFLMEVRDYIEQYDLAQKEKEKVYVQFQAFIWSYDVLDPLIEDLSISDIKVLDHNRVRIKRLGSRETSGTSFRSEKHYKQFVNHVATKNKINLSSMNALQTFTDKESSPDFILRFNISTGFVNAEPAPYLHIRKIAKRKYTLEELTKMKMMGEETAAYLKEAARSSAGMLFCGKGASGKTTLMNVLLDYIDRDKSGLVIQENEELFSKEHPDIMFQKTVTNNGEGKIQYELKDLARNGLLTDLDYFIIGEIKGAEAKYFLNAAFTGHQCWASIHSPSSREAFDKLADYAQYESASSRSEIIKMLKSLETIVFMKDFQVAEISRVLGWDEEKEKIIYQSIPVHVPEKGKGGEADNE